MPSYLDSTDVVASPTDRLIEGADIENIIQHIADFYELGEVTKYSEIGVGYEDCNVIIESSTGKYVAKLFAHTRTAEQIDRYVKIMNLVTAAGVRHPELIAGKSGNFALHYGGVWAVLAHFIDGKTFYELGRAPNSDERKEILGQVAKINSIDHDPFYISGSWVMSRYHEMLDQVRNHFTSDELDMLAEIATRYDNIPTDTLEKTFIHSDLRTTNVLLGSDGNIYILDYFLANNYLRIRELAVAIIGLFYDESSDKSLDEMCREVVDEYGDFDEGEYKYLHDYVLAMFAIEFLGGTYARHVQDNQTDENTYWLERGRSGMKKYLDRR